jgi:hypothetical protein
MHQSIAWVSTHLFTSIARAEDQQEARDDAGAVIDRLVDSLRAVTPP